MVAEEKKLALSTHHEGVGNPGRRWAREPIGFSITYASVYSSLAIHSKRIYLFTNSAFDHSFAQHKFIKVIEPYIVEWNMHSCNRIV